jgi:hypothetical protein
VALGKRSTTRPKVYKFVHRTDEYIQTNIKGIDYEHEKGWLKIDTSGRLYLNTSCQDGYAWDGCTPKFVFLDLFFGTPDGKLDYATEKPITYYASMTHDLLYQFKKDVPLSRKDADILFYLILKQARFSFRHVYYFFVRCFGGILFPGWKTKSNQKDIQIESCSWVEHSISELVQLNLPQIRKHPFFKIE